MSNYIRSTKQIWEVQGIKVLLHKIKKFLFWKEHNSDIIKIINHYSQNYPIFLDIGAKVGAVTLGVTFNFIKCLCFEPATKNYQQLISNIKASKSDNITAYNFALGKTKGIRKFYLSTTVTGDNRFNITDNEKFHSQDVEVNTLDDILENHGITQKCIIKIDVQGSELDVLQGGQKILEKNCLIISEFWPWGLNLNNTDPMDYVQFIKSLGYGFFDFNEQPISDKYLSRMCILGKTKQYVQDDFIIKKIK